MKKNQGSPVYPRHRLETLEPYYSQHVSAMTSEKLHHKGDIAEQLAWRDQKIAELEGESRHLRGDCDPEICRVGICGAPDDDDWNTAARINFQTRSPLSEEQRRAAEIYGAAYDAEPSDDHSVKRMSGLLAVLRAEVPTGAKP